MRSVALHQVLARSAQRRKHVIRIEVRLFDSWLAKLNHRHIHTKNRWRQPALLEPACQLLTAESLCTVALPLAQLGATSTALSFGV